MLIVKKPVSKDDIVVIKIANGEEIVGKLTNDLTNSYEVKIDRPIIAHAVPSPDGQGMGLAFAPFCPAANDGEFAFPKANLLILPVLARDEIKASYLKMTTGLDMAPPALKL